MVRLRIWREPDLSGDFQVGEGGTVVFPKLGPINVTGAETDSLKHRLVEAYSRFLRDPAIDVVFLRRVNILGAVRNPGLYPVDLTMTLADALALAGGASSEGRPDRVELRRDNERVTVELTGETRLVDTPIQSGDQLFVPQRSWASRNPGIIAGALTAAAGLIVSILVR